MSPDLVLGRVATAPASALSHNGPVLAPLVVGLRFFKFRHSRQLRTRARCAPSLRISSLFFLIRLRSLQIA
eukprot:2308367-Pleurochrysis_carterae.AAC.1